MESGGTVTHGNGMRGADIVGKALFEFFDNGAFSKLAGAEDFFDRGDDIVIDFN
jgi:hypothetical protein